MSNALDEAKRLALEVSKNTSVRLDLSTLQALISELELIKQQFADFTEVREKLADSKRVMERGLTGIERSLPDNKPITKVDYEAGRK